MTQLHTLDQLFPELSDSYTMSLTTQWHALSKVDQAQHILSNSNLWKSWSLLQQYLEIKDEKSRS